MYQLSRLRTISYISNINHARNYSILNKSTVLSYKSLEDRRSTDFQLQKRNFSLETTFRTVWKAISDSTPVAYLQDGLVNLHDTTGLPWWGTIILSTCLLRSFVTFPFAVYQNKITSKIELCTAEMPDLVKELKRETAYAIKKFNWTEKQARIQYNKSLHKQWNKLIIRDNCHPAKTSILMWIQLPLWICQSIAIRNLVYMLPIPSLEAQITFTELTIGGFGWIPNLIEVDASYVLPIALGLINLSIVEMQSMIKLRPPTKLQRYATNFFRGLSVIMVPIAMQVPACLCLYWVTSSCFGLTQNLILLSPKVKRFLGIPKTPSELQEPYKHLENTVKQRWLSLFSKNLDSHNTSTTTTNLTTTTTTTSSKTSTEHKQKKL